MLCDRCGQRIPPDDDELPVMREWLEIYGFRENGIQGMTKLLPPSNPGAAIAELCIAPQDDGWSACLIQGVPDDQHVPDDMVSLTSMSPTMNRAQVRSLCAALGIPLP